MPQDPNLYGQPAPKRQKREMALSGTLDFATQLSSLISKPASPSAASSSTGRPRPSKSKDAFPGVKIKRKDGPAAARAPDPRRLRLKSPLGTEDDKAERARGRRRMEEKARLYAAMQRGDYVAKDGEAAPLVDFDRKWAEGQRARPDGARSSSDDEDYADDGAGSDDDFADKEQVTYTDEFGRERTGTWAEQARRERLAARGAASAAELAAMSARPRAPEEVIRGDAVQTEAFRPLDPEAMAAAAARRDRSPTPPPAAHYDAAAEIRTRGTGFYAFSRAEETRAAEMRGLEEERARTEAARAGGDEARLARRREVEARRAEIAERRAKKLAESFLDGLGRDLAGAGDGGDGGGKGDAGDGEGGNPPDEHA